MRPFATRERTALITFLALVGLALVGWAAARQIRSPAQVAAETAAPSPSAITVPVARRTLSTDVIVRGTVRYGAPQGVVVATSAVKQGSDIVTRPARKGARVRAGDVVMTIDGRPVFVLPGATPMHRDLQPGDDGPDVRQLEVALQRLGFGPGAVDGRYDGATAGAVSRFYLRRGWDPFGATDAQLEQLRAVQASAAAARDVLLQAQGTQMQARVDAVRAREALHTAELGVSTAKRRVARAQDAARAAASAPRLAEATHRKERLAANAEVAIKRAAFRQALTEEQLARIRVGELDATAGASDIAAAAAAVGQAEEEVRRAQAELSSARAAADAVRAGRTGALRTARNEVAQADRDIGLARAELLRARRGVVTARAEAALTAEKAAKPVDASPRAEARRTQAEVDRLAERAGVQVPADEVLFFNALPLRVDSVSANRGSTVAGPVMRVTNSNLAIDSSLSVSDAKLVRAGDPVIIEEQELGVRAQGEVTQVATTPGTNGVDPNRFSITVMPDGAFPSLVGASVKLTVGVKSTEGSVLAVPASALSIGGDGNSRLQVRRDGRTELTPVVPGLAANGLVEVRPAGRRPLDAGDLVVVGRDDATGGGRGP